MHNRKLDYICEAILESIPDGILVVNEQGTVIRTNAKMVKMWQIPDAILASENEKILMDHIRGQLADPDAVIALVKDLYANPEAESLDVIYCKDGRIFKRTSKPMYLAGHRGGRVWSFLDITESKQAEDTLRKSEDLHRNLVQKMPDGVYESTHDGRFVEVNPALVSMLGYSSKEELMAIDIKSQLYFEPADRESLVLQEKLEEMGVYQLKKKDGSAIWVEDHGWYNTDENGDILSHEGILRDITERRRVEEAVRESESRYKILFDTTGTSIVIIEEDMTISLANEEFARRIGYTRNEIEGIKKWTEFINQDDLKLMLEQHRLRREIPESANPSYKFRYTTKHGEQRNALVNVQLLPGSKRTMASLVDITELKRAEQELNFVRLKLELALQSSRMGVWQFNLKENLRSFDNQSCFLLGLDPEKYDGSSENFFAAIHPDDQQKVRMALKKSIEQQVPYEPEYRVVWKDGSVHYIAARGELLLDAQGDPQAINGIIWDITERKKVEEALAREQYLMLMLMDNLPDHIYFKDLQSRFIRINKSHALLFRLDDPDQAIGKTDFDFFSREHALQAYEDEQTIIRTGQPLSIEEKETYSDDRPDSWVSTIKMPLYNREGKIIGTFGISRDISIQQAARQEIELKNEELNKANAEKDKFFSIIAHDLRSPLSSFIGFTQYLAEELPVMAPADLQEMVITMEKSATNLFCLLENLLEWAKMKRGLVSFYPVEVDLRLIVKESIEVLAEIAKTKGITLTSTIPPDLIVIADLNMLQTAIRNFVANAVKFTPKGGIVGLTAQTTGTKNIEISIQDSGIGMSPDMIVNLFQLNAQTNRKGTEGEASSGIGLLLCKEFIEKNGGRIWVESEVGKGSTFHFTLPSINPANPELP